MAAQVVLPTSFTYAFISILQLGLMACCRNFVMLVCMSWSSGKSVATMLKSRSSLQSIKSGKGPSPSSHVGSSKGRNGKSKVSSLMTGNSLTFELGIFLISIAGAQPIVICIQVPTVQMLGARVVWHCTSPGPGFQPCGTCCNSSHEGS